MNILLFFVLPISIIILSIVLQKILRCPALVAATFFAILLIIAYTTTLGNSFLIYVIIYTILAYVTAVLTRLICNIWSRFGHCFTNSEGCICERPCNNRSRVLSTNTLDGNNNGNYYYLTTSSNNNNDYCCCNGSNSTNNVGGVELVSNVNTANNICGADNLGNTNCGRNSASFTVTSSQPNPVFYLTSRSGNRNSNQRHPMQNCCCRRRA